MTQSALDQYALANGYGKTTSAMTEQEKVALLKEKVDLLELYNAINDSDYCDPEELEYNTPRLNNLSWAYLNFLRVKNTIFVPGLHTKEDQMSLEQIQQFYPDCKVIQVQGCEELARDGGALHCVTWNILANVYEKEEA